MQHHLALNHKSLSEHISHLMSGLYVKPIDIGIMIFATLVINMFSLAVPMVTLQVYDRILAFHSIGTLQVLCGGVVFVVFFDIFLRLARASIIGWTSARFEHSSYIQSLRHLMSTKLGALHKYSQGEQLRALSAIAKLKSFYSGQALISLIDMPFVLIFLGFIAYLSGWLVMVPLVLLAAFATYTFFLGRSMKTALHNRDLADDRRTNFVSEVLEKIHTVKMLGLESAFQRRYEVLQGQNVHDSHMLSARNAQAVNAASLFTQVMMVSMIAIGATMVVDGVITMGILIACVLLSGRVMQPVQRALSFWISFQEYQLSQKKVDELFSLPVQQKEGITEIKTPKGKLEIGGLQFAYDEHNSSMLFDGIDLTLTPGKSIALIGPPGDGKTTLLKLIAGLYEPVRGYIRIDGVDVSTYPYGQLPKYVGYLPPESEIFQGTIMDNLTSFRPELEEQAVEMAGHLGIDKVVSKLAQGYHTQLFDGPADPLTPGMKQRITIARVLVNRPRLLLFDFADKSLDKEGYNHMFRLLGQLKGQASMILVSNDRNILHLAQEEYVIENGKLVASDVSSYSKSERVVQPLKGLKA